MKSLRLRLVLLTTTAVAVVWLVAAAFTWRAALHEIEELLDHPPEAVGQIQEERDELTGEIAKHLLMPMLIALPGLALVLAVAVGFSLRPLRRLSDEIAARAPERLTPIASEDAPREIAPLIERLNELFAGIDRALQNERRFTADAAHELRTPLAALKAQTQVAQASIDTAERQRALGQILAGCDRATHLVAQLLTLARLDARSAYPLPVLALHPIAEEVLAMSAGEAIERNCDLVLRDGDASIRGDALLLEVLLRNLVDNALRHGGATLIEVSIARQGDDAVLAVTDNGRGIAREERERVQQRFYRGSGVGAGDTAAKDSPGAGLGLSIAKRITELHGGTLEIAGAERGNGVALLVRLPLATV